MRHASSRARRRRAPRHHTGAGFGLVEVLVAVVVLAVGIVALERLVARSIAVLGAEARRTRALFAASSLLADAALAPPEPGTWAGVSEGLHAERTVRRTPHPALREIAVRVWPDDEGGAPCELVEVVRVPPG